MSVLDKFWLQLEKGQIVRRIAFFGMMWLTYYSYMWVFDYVGSIEVITSNHSMIIGAILGPISALQGAIIKFYAENPYKPNLMIEMEDQLKNDEEK
jgi:hypothetical protein